MPDIAMSARLGSGPMRANTSLRHLRQLLLTICLSTGLTVLGLAPVVDAADQDNGRRHSLLHRSTTGTVPPITSTEGVIVSGTDTQRPQILDLPARPQAPSASTPKTLPPHHKLTKRPGVATVTPLPSPPTTQPPVTKPKAAASSASLSTGTLTGSQGASEGTVVTPSTTSKGLASTTTATATATTRPSSALLASPPTLGSSSLASPSSGTTLTPTIGGSRSAANLLQNPAITSLLQPTAPTVTSPPSSSPPPPSSPPPTPPPSTPPPATPPPPSPPPATGSAALTWSSNGEPDLAGYKLYVGTRSGLYTYPGSPFTIGNINSYVMTNLPSGQTYFFALSAYDSAGNESPLSAEVSKSIY